MTSINSIEDIDVPVHTDFKRGDTVMMDGMQVTLTSWPAELPGYFSWSQTMADGSEHRGTDWYGELPDGSPATASKILTLVESAEPFTTTLPAIDIPIVSGSTGQVADVPAVEEVPGS